MKKISKNILLTISLGNYKIKVLTMLHWILCLATLLVDVLKLAKYCSNSSPKYLLFFLHSFIIILHANAILIFCVVNNSQDSFHIYYEVSLKLFLESFFLIHLLLIIPTYPIAYHQIIFLFFKVEFWIIWFFLLLLYWEWCIHFIYLSTNL